MENTKNYDVSEITNPIEGIEEMLAGQPPEDDPRGKAEKHACDACGRKVRYLFITPKGGHICASCVKLHTGADQKQIDAAYNVAYYDGQGSTRISAEERTEKLSELF